MSGFTSLPKQIAMQQVGRISTQMNTNLTPTTVIAVDLASVDITAWQLQRD
jgi:hypothetical protein